MRCRHVFAAAVAATAPLLQPALADPVKVGTLELTDLWTRATPPKAPTAGGYLTITNTGDAPTGWSPCRRPTPASARSTR